MFLFNFRTTPFLSGNMFLLLSFFQLMDHRKKQSCHFWLAQVCSFNVQIVFFKSIHFWTRIFYRKLFLRSQQHYRQFSILSIYIYYILYGCIHARVWNLRPTMLRKLRKVLFVNKALWFLGHRCTRRYSNCHALTSKEVTERLYFWRRSLTLEGLHTYQYQKCSWHLLERSTTIYPSGQLQVICWKRSIKTAGWAYKPWCLKISEPFDSVVASFPGATAGAWCIHALWRWLDSVLPMKLHCDEGTGQRRAPVMQYSWGPLLTAAPAASTDIFFGRVVLAKNTNDSIKDMLQAI